MTSQIDPTKPKDGVPAEKADLRANLQAAKDEIEAMQIGLMVTETVTQDRIYSAEELAGPLWIQAAPATGPITLTFPDPAAFNLPPNRARLLAIVRAASSDHDVRIDCVAPGRLRSQPGIEGWDASRCPLAVGASLANQAESMVALWLNRSGDGSPRISVAGMVREVSS